MQYRPIRWPEVAPTLAALPLVALLSTSCLAAGVPAPAALEEQVAPGEGGWRPTGDHLTPRLRLDAEVVDAEPAVLEAEVRGDGPFAYTVDWGDGSRPEAGRRQSGAALRLTHDYDLISTYRVALRVRRGKETSALEAGLVTVKDDDDDPPRLELTLPPAVLRPGQPAVLRWKITDPSGLAFVFVDVDAPGKRLGRFETAEGSIDLTGRGLGVFAIQVRTEDADADRPGDSLGFLISESVVVTDDLDGDGILDYLDNCPHEDNQEQSDADNDGLGDVCDPCPRVNGRCEGDSGRGGEGQSDESAGRGSDLPGLAGLAWFPWLSPRWRRARRAPARQVNRKRPLHIDECARARAHAARPPRIWIGLVVAAGALTSVLTATVAMAAPVVTSIRPTSSLVGEPVVIRGTGFGTAQGAGGRVTFGGVDAGTVYHWTDDRITVEVPVGSLVAGVPTPTPTGVQPVVVRTAAAEDSAPVDLDIEAFNVLPRFRHACRCGDPGCTGPCLPDDYCRINAGGCTFDGGTFGWRDIKDVDFGDWDDDGDLDIVDISSPNCATCPAGVMPGIPFYCASPVNFPDRLFRNEGGGRYLDITGGTDGDYGTEADNPLPYFHSYRTYDADLVDVDNDGYLDFVRADRNFCAGEASHYFKNVDTSGDGVPDTKFQGFAIATSNDEAYWDNLAIGDLEGDGDLDLLVSHSDDTPSTHALQINDGTGSFTEYDPMAMAPTHAADDDFTDYLGVSHDMALVDLDGDRDQDIVIGAGNHYFALANQVLLNRFAETGELFFESIPIPNAAELSLTVHVGAADINGDGRPDIHFVNDDGGPADRLFLNLGGAACGSAADTGCPDGLSCTGAGLAVASRICWQDASPDLPEGVAGTETSGYGADYADVDADGDLDILVTGLSSSGNYLFLNRAGTACASDADCPAGHGCVTGGCRPSSAQTTPKWWSCPTMGSGASAVACLDRDGVAVTGTAFPAAREERRSLAVVFGDADGDTDVDVLWGRGQWGPSTWERWPDAGPLLLVADGERPYVKRVTVLSGPRIVYQAAWAPNVAGTHLAIAPATFDAAAPFTALRTQDVTIEVEFSEPMESAAITAVSPLGLVPTLASSQPAGGRTIWRGTLSNLDIADNGSHDGTHTLTITGSDLVGHPLLQIAARGDIPLDALRDGATGNDTIHGLRIGPLSGVIPVTAIFMKQAVADPGAPPIADRALALQTALNDYFDEVSYSEISFAVTGVGWHQLDQPVAWYDTLPRTPLVDLVQEALDDAAGAVDLSTTHYALVVTEETSAPLEWSTTGGWPYTIGGAPQLIAAGVLDVASSDERLSHLAGRLVGLIDLFAHPEVTALRPFVGPWSHMSDRDGDVHVLGWEKWRAGWIDETGTATGKTLTRVPKPASPSTPIVNQTHVLSALDSDTDAVKMVAIDIADRLHFTAEYRRQQGLDAALPDAGVVLVKANDLVAQGEGPAILQESPVTAGDLDDAPFVDAALRNVFTDAGSGVRVEVLSMNATEAEIRLDYDVPDTQNDVYVALYDDRWETVDIWVDAPNLTLEFEADPRTVQSSGERPVTGYLNKVIGRVRNDGPADATNFEVELEILEPWGTGGPWRSLKVDTVTLLQGQDTNPSADYLIVADWTPTGDVHTCVRLRVRTVPNDVNPDNNETQENIHQFSSTPGSPYTPVTSRFQVDNPYGESIPVLFRLDGLPAGWSHVITPARPVLAPGEVVEAQITLQPADGAPLCSREEITLSAYAPRVDTLKRMGALTLAVELQGPAEVTAESELHCKQSDLRLSGRYRSCALVTRGCTDPVLANTQVAVVYTAPDGSTQVRYVTTDETGCYVDVLPGVAPGLWQVTAVLEEEECRVEDRTPADPVFVPPGFGGPLTFGVFTGGNWPLGDLDDYSPSFTFGGQAEWALTAQLRLGVQLAYHAFDAEPAAGVDNLGFTNLSAIARWVGGGTVVRPYLQAGPGGYYADGDWDVGLLAGAGIELPITPAVSLASGFTLHQVDRSTEEGTRPRWVDGYIGFFVSLGAPRARLPEPDLVAVPRDR